MSGTGVEAPPKTWDSEVSRSHGRGGSRPHFSNAKDNRTVSSLPPIPVKGIDYTRSTIIELLQLVSKSYHDPVQQKSAVEYMKHVMSGNFDIDHRIEGYNMRTVLMEAAYYRNSDACLALLSRKANPNSRGKFGRTALHIAATNSSAKVTRALLQARVRPTHVNLLS